MLARNIRVEEDLVDQLFNSSEKRLARTLLLLARYGDPQPAPVLLPRLSQELLAEMVGTTRSRVNFFMNKFRKLGFIDYNGAGLKVARLAAQHRPARLSAAAGSTGGAAVQFRTPRQPADATSLAGMRIDTMKATLGGAWLIALGAIALSDVVSLPAAAGRCSSASALVPVVIMWMFWNAAHASLSESIGKARE